MSIQSQFSHRALASSTRHRLSATLIKTLTTAQGFGCESWLSILMQALAALMLVLLSSHHLIHKSFPKVASHVMCEVFCDSSFIQTDKAPREVTLLQLRMRAVESQQC